MRSKTTWLTVLILLVAIIGPAGSVLAEETGEDAADEQLTDEQPSEELGFDELVRRGSQAFEAKDYAAAVAAFEAAYEIRAVPNLLYNIARTYERNGDFDEAVTYYERFVNQPEVDLKARRDALERLKTLREVLALREEGEEVDREEVEREGREPALAEPTESTEPAESSPPSPTSPVPQPSYVPGVIVASLGGVGLGMGGVMGVLATSSLDDADRAPTLEARRAAIDRAHTQAAIADGIYVGGGIMTAIGIYLLLSPPGQESGSDTAAQSPRPRLAPTLGPNGASMTFTYDF